MITKLEDSGDGSGDLILPLSTEILSALGVSVGDNLDMDVQSDGSIVIKKSAKKTKLILTSPIKP